MSSYIVNTEPCKAKQLARGHMVASVGVVVGKRFADKQVITEQYGETGVTDIHTAADSQRLQ